MTVPLRVLVISNSVLEIVMPLQRITNERSKALSLSWIKNERSKSLRLRLCSGSVNAAATQTKVYLTHLQSAVRKTQPKREELLLALTGKKEFIFP